MSAETAVHLLGLLLTSYGSVEVRTVSDGYNVEILLNGERMGSIGWDPNAAQRSENLIGLIDLAVAVALRRDGK